MLIFIVLRETLWKALQKWVETEYDGQIFYSGELEWEYLNTQTLNMYNDGV